MTQGDGIQDNDRETYSDEFNTRVIRLAISRRAKAKVVEENEENTDLEEDQESAGMEMFESRKHISPPQGIPERWVKLLHKTHEVSSRIAQSIRNTIEHGESRFDGDASKSEGSHGEPPLGSYRSIGPSDV
jgi:hypothetical protein